MLKQLLLRVYPGDRTLLALLALANIVCWVRWPSVGAALTPIALSLLALLLGVFGITVVLTNWENRPWVPLVRAAVTVTVIFSLYTALGTLGRLAMPYVADSALSRADNWLLGFDPSLAIQPYQTPARIDFLSLIYVEASGISSVADRHLRRRRCRAPQGEPLAHQPIATTMAAIASGRVMSPI